MNLFVGSLLLLVIVPACTTPPEIKQAVVAKDVAYAENARLMTIHRELLESIDTGIGTGTAMQRNWPCSIKR